MKRNSQQARERERERESYQNHERVYLFART